MKKLLGISLVAMMAVTSARADIASKAYVDVSGTHPIVSASNTTGANIGALADAIGELPEGKTAAQAIADAVSGSSGAIDALNLTAVTGVIKSVSQTKGQVAATAGTIADADVAADANIAQSKIANLTTDLAAKASASDLTAETTARENADTAINTKIGTVPENSTVMAEIAKAQTAATYDDTALAGRVTTAEGNITTLQSDKQDKSKSTVASAGNYIAAGDGVAANLGALDTQLKTASDAAAAAIPAPTADCANPTNKCVLTSAGSGNYAWEVIARGTGE